MMTKTDATRLAARFNIPLDQNFHTLDSFTVERILDAADDYGYRKPANANGSRGRYFYAYLNRVIWNRS